MSRSFTYHKLLLPGTLYLDPTLIYRTPFNLVKELAISIWSQANQRFWSEQHHGTETDCLADIQASGMQSLWIWQEQHICGWAWLVMARFAHELAKLRGAMQLHCRAKQALVCHASCSHAKKGNIGFMVYRAVYSSTTSYLPASCGQLCWMMGSTSLIS